MTPALRGIPCIPEFTGPEWMRTFKAIRQEAARFRPLRTGSDRSKRFRCDHRTGALYWRPAIPVSIGEVYGQQFLLNASEAGEQRWNLHFRVLRVARWSEVRAVAPRDAVVPRKGWFLVHAD